MSKCVYCQERKGKRPCPALQGMICSHCCGTARVVSITCPPDCLYLDNNLEYQQKRMGDVFEQSRKSLYRNLLENKGDKAAEVFYFLEAVTFKHFHHRREGQDGEVIAAIQGLRRSFSLIHVPEGMAPPFTETLKKEYKAFMEGEKIDEQFVMDVIDEGLTFITQFSGDSLRSSRFLNGLIGFLKSHHPDVAQQLIKLSDTGGAIIIPGGANMESQLGP